MADARVIWTDKDRFLGEAASGHALVVDATEPKTANSPMELVLLALCGCTAADVVSILRKKREPFFGVEVTAHGERAVDHPKVYTHINLVYRVRGKVTHKAVEDAIRLSKEKYCSVSAMLEKTATIETSIEYVEE
jgi:putative redox protein